MKISVIVPVYNEGPTVRTILEQLASFQMPGVENEIIVVDGASTDGTKETVKAFENKPGFKMFYEDRPRGRGVAISEGFKLATGDVVFFQDADLEYSVSDYPAILRPFIEKTADVVVGKRVAADGAGWKIRQFSGFEKIYGFVLNFGGLAYTKLFNFLYGTSLSDGAAMFKVFRREFLNEITLESDGFDYDWELLGKLARKGYRIAEVPVSYKARGRAEGKKIRFWRDGWKVFLAITKYRFKKIKY